MKRIITATLTITMAALITLAFAPLSAFATDPDPNVYILNVTQTNNDNTQLATLNLNGSTITADHNATVGASVTGNGVLLQYAECDCAGATQVTLNATQNNHHNTQTAQVNLNGGSVDAGHNATALATVAGNMVSLVVPQP